MPGDFGSFIAQKRKVAKETGTLNERVQVFCRLRPPNPAVDTAAESSSGDANGDSAAANAVHPVEDHDAAAVRVRDLDGKLKEFKFDRFFGAAAAQRDVFEAAAAPVIDAVVEGHNGTIFAYGQTGSGKTHTMLGPVPEIDGEGANSAAAMQLPSPEQEGIIPRGLRRLFANVAAQEATHEFKITVSYIQIYCEILSDLLQPSNADSLVIRERSGRSNEVYVSGASRFGVASADECLRHIQAGSLNRATAFTQMNASSSRSHAVFILSLEKRPKANRDADGQAGGGADGAGGGGAAAQQPPPQKQMVRSQLFLVDLAGSERVASTGIVVGSDRFRELRAINLSLSALGNCIHALSSAAAASASATSVAKSATGAPFVPYRDSKLTRLLQNSLGGNSKTSLVITVGPSPRHARETLSTLQFGTRAMAVKVTSVVNIEVDYKALYQNLLSEADKRDDRIHQLELSEREHRVARERAEKSKERAESRAQKLELELQVQKASTEKLEAALKDNFLKQDEEDAADAECEAVFLTGEGIESPKRGSAGSEARLALEMEQKMRAEVEAMSAQFEEQVTKIRDRSQRRIDLEQKKAAKAVADWHALELELANTKEEMLSTLQRQREVQAEIVDLEADSTERIADLLLKVQDLEADLEEARGGGGGGGGGGGFGDEQIDAIRERVEQRVLENYVSQDKVVEMKQLYEDVVTKLEGRIDKLEVDVTKAVSPSKGKAGAPKAGSSSRRRGVGGGGGGHHHHHHAQQRRGAGSTSRGGRGSRLGGGSGVGKSSSTARGSQSSSHVSVVRSRAHARVAQSNVTRSSYSLSSTRGGRGTAGASSTKASSSFRTSAAAGGSRSTTRTRAKEYAEKQRAAKLLADAARIRNRRTKKSSSSSAAAVARGGASGASGGGGGGGFGSSRARPRGRLY